MQRGRGRGRGGGDGGGEKEDRGGGERARDRARRGKGEREMGEGGGNSRKHDGRVSPVCGGHWQEGPPSPGIGFPATILDPHHEALRPSWQTPWSWTGRPHPDGHHVPGGTRQMPSGLSCKLGGRGVAVVTARSKQLRPFRPSKPHGPGGQTCHRTGASPSRSVCIWTSGLQ